MSYADTDADSYISVTGTAQFYGDQAKKEQLWTPLTQAWFPGGVTDPDLALALLEVNISHAEYWGFVAVSINDKADSNLKCNTLLN